jgi:hypothetical protein
MVGALINHEAVGHCHLVLHTKDAQGVYRKLGFIDLMGMFKRRRVPYAPSATGPNLPSSPIISTKGT